MSGAFGKVAVLAGGLTERDISLASGRMVHETLRGTGVQSHLVDVGVPGKPLAMDVLGKLQALAPDRVFIALHGGDGENGVVQALCAGMGLPYTGSGVAACALARDKHLCKQLWASQGLPVLPGVVLSLADDPHAKTAELNYPLAVKPVDGGSSLGVSRVNVPSDLPTAVALARCYGTRVLVEPWALGEEITVGLLGCEILPVMAIKPAQGFYDYDAKYLRDDTQYFPWLATAGVLAKVRSVAKRAFELLGCVHFARVDLLTDASGAFYLMEMNTVPGLTDHSLVPKAAALLGMDFAAVLDAVLSATLPVGEVAH